MTTADVVIRRASLDELDRLCEFFREDPIPGGKYHVAVTGRFARIIGFLCVAIPEHAPGEASFRWRIVPAYRGSLVEQRLIELAIAESQASGAAALITMDMQSAGGTADRLLETAGFTVTLADDLYEMDLIPMLERMSGVCAQLEARGRLPAAAKVVALDARNWPAVARLAGRHGLLPQACVDADFGECGYFAEVSTVLLAGGVVGGTLLARPCGRVAEIAVMVIDDELRSRTHWANALLSCGAARRGISAGIEVLRFRCHPLMSREIQNLARRSGGRIVARQHARVLKLPVHETALTT